MSVAGYSATYLGTTFNRGSNHDELRGQFALSYDAEPIGIVAAGKNHYNVEQFFSSAVGIHTDWLRAADVMLIGDQFDKDGSVFLKIAVNPLIDLIWLAGRRYRTRLMTLPLILSGAVTAGALLYVVQPFFRNPPPATTRADAHGPMPRLEESGRCGRAVERRQSAELALFDLPTDLARRWHTSRTAGWGHRKWGPHPITTCRARIYRGRQMAKKFSKPTRALIRSDFWRPREPRLLIRTACGRGWAINFACILRRDLADGS